MALGQETLTHSRRPRLQNSSSGHAKPLIATRVARFLPVLDKSESRYVCPCIARKGCECGRVHTSSGDWSALVSAGTVSPSNEERNRETPCAERVLVRGSSASNPCSALTRRCGPLSPSRDRAHDNSAASIGRPTLAQSGAAIRAIRSACPEMRAAKVRNAEFSFSGIERCWPERMPEAALNYGNSQCSAELRWRSVPSIQHRTRELPVKLRTVVLAVKTPDAGSPLITTERVVNALPTTLRRIVEPDSQLVFEQRRQSTNFGLGIAIRVEDSGERAGDEIFAYAVLTESTPFNMAQQNMTQRVNERPNADRKRIIEIRLPPALAKTGHLSIQPGPRAFGRRRNRGLDPAIVDEPGHDTNRIELKKNTLGDRQR